MQEEAIRFYCGLNEKTWNHHPVQPGPYACIAPVYGKTLRTKAVNRVEVPEGTEVIQDSGAFSDGPGQRLSLELALERQLIHEQTYKYTDKITHRASYDLLIDEKWEGGVRRKARWTESDAERAVQITVAAARYSSHNRHGKGAVLSVQGVSARQYVRCAEQIIPLLEADDILGLGGWCIIGKLPSQMLLVFKETINELIPFLGREGVRWVHVWGVIFPPALAFLLRLCDQYGIKLSTDSAGPSRNPAFGSWGYGEWRMKKGTYPWPPILQSCKSGKFDQCYGCRGLERARHVRATYWWLARFRSTPHYQQTVDFGAGMAQPRCIPAAPIVDSGAKRSIA